MAARRGCEGVEGERRPLSILFTANTASTALAEGPDPAEWREVLCGAHLGVGKTVARYAEMRLLTLTFQTSSLWRPSISITSPGSIRYSLNQAVAASYSRSDGGSTVASCAGTVNNGSNIDTRSAGPKTFTVNASDQVGNTRSQSVPYVVAFPL